MKLQRSKLTTFFMAQPAPLGGLADVVRAKQSKRACHDMA